jgi:protein SCO1/2
MSQRIMARDNRKEFTAKTRKRKGIVFIRICLHLCVLVLVSLFFFQHASADEIGSNHVKVGIEEKLGHYIPMNLKFRDESGNEIELSQISNGKPLIIDMAYFECPGICDVVMRGIKGVLENTSEAPGRDFNIATISFNAADNPSAAKEKKAQFWGTLGRTIPTDAWRFLTGDSASIFRLTNALGFFFVRDSYGKFTHPTGLVVVDREGKIVRYIQGATFALADVEMALREARSGSAEQIISSSPEVCFSHDPSGVSLTDNVLKAGGVGTLVLVAAFAAFLKVKRKSKEDPR